MKPRVLSIGTDSSVFVDPSADEGLFRRVLFAENTGLTVHLARTSRAGGNRELWLSDHLLVLPSNSRGKLAFLWDAYRMGTREARARGIDLVSAENPFFEGFVGWLVAARTGAGLNIQIHADMVGNPVWRRERSINRVKELVAGFVLSRADTFRVVSTSEKRKLLKTGFGEEQIFVVSCFADYAAAYEGIAPSLEGLGLPAPPGPTILWAGRMVAQKDLGTLIQAFHTLLRTHQDARLVLCGEGPLRTQAQRCVEALGLGQSVAMPGRLAHSQLLAALLAADVFALSSRYEGNARVLLEAAAAALPIVTTAVSGAEDSVADGSTGYVVPVGDAGALAARLAAVLDRPDRGQEMGRAGRSLVLERYEPHRLAAEYGRMYSETVRAAERRRGGTHRSSYG